MKTQNIQGFFLPNLFVKYPDSKLPTKNPKKIAELSMDLCTKEIFQSLCIEDKIKLIITISDPSTKNTKQTIKIVNNWKLLNPILSI